MLEDKNHTSSVTAVFFENDVLAAIDAGVEELPTDSAMNTAAAGENVQQEDAPRRAILEQIERLRELLVLKNRAYGNSAMQEPIFLKSASKEDAIMVRAGDKVARLSNLLKSGGEVNDESISDTIRDLAGYCILWLAVRAEAEK